MSNDIVPIWSEEPDEVYFEIEGYKCAINRVEYLGHLCGYVGIQSGIDFDEDDLDVHGEITYSEKYEDIPEKFKEHFKGCVRVIGFDCAHSHYMDLVPAVPILGGIYRDVYFVRQEIINLVKQLKIIVNKNLLTDNNIIDI